MEGLLRLFPAVLENRSTAEFSSHLEICRQERQYANDKGTNEENVRHYRAGCCGPRMREEDTIGGEREGMLRKSKCRERFRRRNVQEHKNPVLNACDCLPSLLEETTRKDLDQFKPKRVTPESYLV